MINIRQVTEVDENCIAKVVQINNYYPFGTPFYDEANTINAGVQPFKYNGKELDMMHGLNTYDYGARQYYPALPVWDRVDPLAEKYRETSPYVYCLNNPINRVDPDGRNPIYNSSGIFLGTSKEGFTGQIYVYTGVENIDFNKYDINYLTDQSGDYGFDFKTYDEVEQSYTGTALSNFVSNVLNNVVSHFNGIKILDDKIFNTSELKDGEIKFSIKKGSNFSTLMKHGNVKAQVDAHQKITESYEGTVENLASSIIVHEWYSHGQYKVGSQFKNHYIAYKNVMNDKNFYPKTTKKYKSFVENGYKYYKNKEKR